MSLLTKSGGFLGPVATVLGYVMSGIFAILVAINIPNIGLAIILFTIVIYMLMLPLTYRQQKFSRMTPLMNPELNAIREKYKGKQDQVSMQRMNEETQMVYAKYGVNPAGSCVQLAIQMLILFPLYRVIMNIPAYVSQVKDVFTSLAGQLYTTAGAEEYLKEIATGIQATTINKSFTENTIIDTLYKFRPATWTGLAEKFPDLSDVIAKTQKTIGGMNNFLGLDIANTPMNIIREHASVWLVIAAVLVPILAALSQWISVKLSMAGSPQPEGNDQMAGTMKTMNNVMP
ncbi:MAG: membrane protein insertase YidC, partial [Clostridiales bacterium]|nr:membrane protein insertase YidC [Clostridiales bacterium]